MVRRQEESDEEEEEEEEKRSSDESSGDEELSSGSGSESSGEEDEEEEEEEEAEDDEAAQKAAAKYNLVEADLVEIKKMMDEMDRIKMRLQFRLAREAADASHGPLHRRSSVEDICVPPPPTVSASVQTAWDMSRMYEVEKLVSSTEAQATKTLAQDHQDTPVPVNKSVQLSLQDLARSYGVQEALYDKGSSFHDQSPTKINTRASATRQYGGSSGAPPSKLQSHMWNGLGIGGMNADHTNGSDASDEQPPKINRSQLIPDPSEQNGASSSRAPSFTEPMNSTLEDSFGIPTSPTKSDESRAMDATSSGVRSGSDHAKTVEQKEMEAMKSLLFF